MALGLIDRIYECAFAPELWPGVLDDLGGICEARGGVLFAANRETGAVSYTASDTHLQCAREYERRRLHMDGVATQRLLAFGQHGFIFDHDVIAQAEMETDPVFTAVLWPAGLGHSIGTTISAPTGDVLLCLVSRGREQGPARSSCIRKLNRLRPHLARSALMSARLRLERARAVVETLDLLGLPALVFDPGGRVIAANPLIEAERERLRWRARDRVAFVDKVADEMLRRCIETIADDEQGAARSFAVRDSHAVAAIVAHVVPIRGVSCDIFARAVGVMMLTPVAMARAPAVELVQSLFDLTPAEARVARALTVGQTLQRIADDSCLSQNTVRTHLRAVLEKTGCNRQAEVVALLSGLARPGA